MPKVSHQRGGHSQRESTLPYSATKHAKTPDSSTDFHSLLHNSVLASPREPDSTCAVHDAHHHFNPSRSTSSPATSAREHRSTSSTATFSEASTVIDNETWYPTNFSHHHFEFDHISQVRDDECLVQWTDSQISSSDLKFGLLNGVPIYTWVERAVPLGAGLVNITWKLTWEPKTSFTSYLHSMDQDPRLCASEETCADWVMQSYSPCILHESLLDEAYLHGILLRDAVLFSDDVDGEHGFLYITWKQFMLELEAAHDLKSEQ
jgi:hypothetical protein